MKSQRVWMGGVAAAIAVMLAAAGASAKTWTGGDGNWFVDANWDPIGVPGNGATVFINTGATVLLTNETAELASLTMTGGTLTFSNWTTRLRATTVTLTDGELTLPAAFEEGAMSNRIHVVCSNFHLNAGATLNANASGYVGGHGQGAGGAGGGDGGGGAGYGGAGGLGAGGAAGGSVYGSLTAPSDPGSGGGAGYVAGGSGGGAVWIQAESGTVSLAGQILANGAHGTSRDGGGSGGSIYIQCRIFEGTTNALLSANGGNGHNNSYGYSSGGGGAGRIAIDYDVETQAAEPRPGVRFSTRAGICGHPPRAYGNGEWGTVHLSGSALLGETLTDWQFREVNLFMQGVTEWGVAGLSVSNCSVRFMDAIPYSITNDLVVGINGNLGVTPGRYLTCGGDIVLTNGGALRVYASPTNSTTPAYGAMVAITGRLDIAAGSWLYPYSCATNGGSVRVQSADINLAAGGGVNANDAGYRRGFGPGKGANGGGHGGGGGGFGGKGGTGAGGAAGGPAYGWINAPITPGSPGGDGYGPGANGGGVVWLEALNGEVRIDGTISANGGGARRRSGGCAGGGIFIVGRTFAGGGGAVIRANGSNGLNNDPNYHSGGGGGGRVTIAVAVSSDDLDLLYAGLVPAGMTVYGSHNAYEGTLSATNGAAGHTLSTQNYGEPGTIRFVTTAYNLTINGAPGEKGLPSPLGYGTHPGMTSGVRITNSVVTPADEVDGERWSCLGWTVSNLSAVVATDSSSQAIFDLTENLLLTWAWTNEWLLTVDADPNGSVNADVVNGWYTNATVVSSITATPSNGYTFATWIGPGVPAGHETDNPLTVTMDRARAIRASFASIAAEHKVWTGVGAWESATNWVPVGMPSERDTVTIASGTVLFANSRTINQLLVDDGGIMIFSNWPSILTVSQSVTVAEGGLITLPSAFAQNGMSNRIAIVCRDFTVDAGGVIDANAAGYSGGHGPGKGSGGGNGGGGGAGYGGLGGLGWGGAGGGAYGILAMPTDPGSGGGSGASDSTGGAGGGAVWIQATSGAVRVFGHILANGANGTNRDGGGSGGSIYIQCRVFEGTINGLLSANGGNGHNNQYFYSSGGGSGGRIAVEFDVAEQVALQRPAVRFSTRAGLCGHPPRTSGNGDWGTAHLSGTALLGETLTDWQFREVALTMQDVVEWQTPSLSVSNCSVRFESPVKLTVEGGLRVGQNGRLDVVVRERLTCAGVTITNQGQLHLYAGHTLPGELHAGVIQVAQTITVGPQSWIYPYVNPTNGGFLRFVAGTIDIAESGGFDAVGRGFQSGYGTGKGANGGGHGGGGGGYGGKGGNGAAGAAGGTDYGDPLMPLHPGSPGGNGMRPSLPGGGVVWLEVLNGAVCLNGAILADGAGPLSRSGGSAGGSIFIATANLLAGPAAQLSARGTDGDGHQDIYHSGGGGGGRIAVWSHFTPNAYLRLLNGELVHVAVRNEIFGFPNPPNVSGGTAYLAINDGEPGTIRHVVPVGSMIMVR